MLTAKDPFLQYILCIQRIINFDFFKNSLELDDGDFREDRPNRRKRDPHHLAQVLNVLFKLN